MKLAVLFENFGPYHAARLGALAARAPRGWPLTAIEIAGASVEYGWQRPCHRAFESRTIIPASNLLQVPRGQLIREVFRTLDDVHPDVLAIAGYSEPAMLAAFRWGQKYHVPMVLMSDSQQCGQKRPWYKEWIKSLIVRGYTAGFVAGRRHIEYLESLGMPRHRICTGYDVVDNGHFTSRADETRLDPVHWRRQLELPERYFLTCARFIPEKNLPFFLRAYARYRNLHRDPWDLVLVGDGELRCDLLIECQALNLVGHVHFAGFHTYEDIPRYYGLAKVLVHASVSDTWALVVNEAMACGLPVLVSEACGCAPDLVINGENGYTFSESNEAELTELLVRVSSDEGRLDAMGEASRRIIANWSLEKFADGLWKAAQLAHVSRVRSQSVSSRILTAALAYRALG